MSDYEPPCRVSFEELEHDQPARPARYVNGDYSYLDDDNDIAVFVKPGRKQSTTEE